ncbi:MAG TPA: hypothetical protein VMK42_15145 [Anaeromyxobacteraceae bacterium]|nr:hypothetical protein [Anaeromyxobacteraceae bacterium]
MTRKRVWSPADGPQPAPQQRPPARFEYFDDGEVENELEGLSTPSEGPFHSEYAGPRRRTGPAV